MNHPNHKHIQTHRRLAVAIQKKLTISPNCLSLVLLTLSLCFSTFAEARTWTSADDPTKTFEAKFKSLDGGLVTLVKKNGSLFRVRSAILSAEDQKYIKEAHRKNTAKKAPIREGLTVHVLGDHWNYPNAKLAKVLQFAADTLTTQFEGKPLIDIDVKKGGWPFTTYGVNKRGHKAVTITPGGSTWNQQVYQFGHELCHTLCRHKNGDKNNLWFEESICEMASLYVLDRVSEEWAKHPPLPGSKGYAKHFKSYVLRCKNDKKSKIQEGMTFVKWFKENRQKLIDGKGDARDQQRTVALHILPMVEKNPKDWGAFYYLDVGKTGDKISFEKFIQQWQENSSKEYHPFITNISKLFDL